MPAQLTLVADNRPRAARPQPAAPDRPREQAGSRDSRQTGGALRPDTPAWVHDAWRPSGDSGDLRPASRAVAPSPGKIARSVLRAVLGGRRANEAKGSPEPTWKGRRAGTRLSQDDTGAVTAEYAIIIMAGVAFAGLLVAIMRSGEIRQMLVDLVQNALGSAG